MSEKKIFPCILHVSFKIFVFKTDNIKILLTWQLNKHTIIASYSLAKKVSNKPECIIALIFCINQGVLNFWGCLMNHKTPLMSERNLTISSPYLQLWWSLLFLVEIPTLRLDLSNILMTSLPCAFPLPSAA